MFTQPQCSPSGFTKSGSTDGFRPEEEVCFAVVLSVSSLCDSEVTTLKSRSSISTETRIQSQMSSNLSHRIWPSDCLACSLSFPFLCGLKPHLGPASVWLTTVVNWATSLTQMCLLPSYVKRAYKSPLVSFHPLTPASFMHLRYAFFFSSIHSCPALIFPFRNKLSNTELCSTCSTQSQTQTRFSYSWRNAPALQIIVWFVGSVTNYWRMIVVYSLTQRPQPCVASKNRGIVTPRSISYGKTSSRPVGHNGIFTN